MIIFRLLCCKHKHNPGSCILLNIGECKCQNKGLLPKHKTLKSLFYVCVILFQNSVIEFTKLLY